MCVCYIHLLIWCWMHLASWLNENKKFASVSWWTGRRKKHCLLGTMLSIAMVCTQPGNLIYLLHFPVFCDSKSILHSLWKYIGKKWEKLTGWKDRWMYVRVWKEERFLFHKCAISCSVTCSEIIPYSTVKPCNCLENISQLSSIILPWIVPYETNR